MLDADFNSWLIEVNTNPCLEESSKLLEQLIPRMLDDLFKLTIDKVFTSMRKEPVLLNLNSNNLMSSVLKQRTASQIQSERGSLYKVQNHSNAVNMWEKLTNLSKTLMPVKQKVAKGGDSYNASDYMIHLMSPSRLRIVKANVIEQMNVGLCSQKPSVSENSLRSSTDC